MLQTIMGWLAAVWSDLPLMIIAGTLSLLLGWDLFRVFVAKRLTEAKQERWGDLSVEEKGRRVERFRKMHHLMRELHLPLAEVTRMSDDELDDWLAHDKRVN